MASKISAATQDVIQKTVESYPKKWTQGICAYTGINRNNGDLLGNRYDDTRGRNGDVCHAGLFYYQGVDFAKDVVVVNAHKASWQKDHPDFLKWCCKESPFKHGVLNRGDDDQILNHAAVLDGSEIGMGGVLWVCKAVRHFTEFKHGVDTWDKLRGEGLDGLQALIGADILDYSGGPSFGDHTSVFAYSSPANLRKMYDTIRETKRIDGREASQGRGNYNINVWGSMKGKKIKKPDGWGGYIEVDQPCGVKEYAALLREIFEGDPKNVG